jgi:hypothetical protein
VFRRQYRLALYDEEGNVIKGAEFMYASDGTPTPGLRIELPLGTWFVHEVAATWSEDESSRLVSSDPPYGGTLICHPAPPQ